MKSVSLRFVLSMNSQALHNLQAFPFTPTPPSPSPPHAEPGNVKSREDEGLVPFAEGL